ncbi:MAG: hypothetical protein IK077_04860 [Thermoguttaceae bacterium]|nr:hypothetical protein [Thermoguttaceae bacterium]
MMNLFRSSKRATLTCLALFVVAFCAGHCFAAQNLFSGGKAAKIDADPKKDYFLTESDGNWFAMVKKFSGDSAAIQAKRLAYELRASYKMNAFVFKYDPDKTEMDALSTQLGKTKKFHYQTSRAVEYAVLVGGFPTGEDLELQKTLEKIRRLQPKSLKDDPQSKAAVENFKVSAKTDPRYAGYGPLGGAIPVPNPLLPPEFFNHKGVVDPFVAKLNSDSKYSLLNNKKTYTVRIATFSGDSSMKKSNEAFNDLETRLQYAGLRAAALCEALRNQGVEAWEFHDRDCSFVTIGSFDQYGTLQQDGHTELTPEVGAIMKKYGGELVADEDGRSKYKAYTIVVEIPDPSSSSFAPKKKKLTIACDVRPVIIVVPQRSGEESVKKIALATKQMDKVKQQMVENEVERSLEAAEDNLESAQQFAHANGQALTEEEYLAWAAKTAPKKQSPQKAASNGSYADQTKSQQNTSASQTQAATATKYARSAIQTTPTTTQGLTVATNPPTSTKKEAPVAQRPYGNSGAKTQKTAQRPAAPTY